jgi:hypothetical protein
MAKLPRGNHRAARLALMVALLLSFCSAYFFTTTHTAHAATYPPCGVVVLSGSDWAGGNGVDVHSNGDMENTGDSCGGFVTKLDANPPQYGWAWQCVELAARMYKTHGWAFPSGNAKDLYTNAAAAGLTTMANGSVVLANVVPGDMIVSHEGTAGHVVVVDRIAGSTINVVEQNANVSGSATVTFKDGTLTRGTYFQITGVVHSPSNTLTNTSSTAVINSVKSGLSPDGAIEAFAVTQSRVTEGWYRNGGDGAHVSTIINIAQNDIKGIDKINNGTTESLYTAVSDGVWESWWNPSVNGPQSAKIVAGLSGVTGVIAENTLENGYTVHHLYVLASDGPYEVYWKDSDPNHVIHVGRLISLTGGIAFTHSIGPDGSEQLYVAVPTWVYEVSWLPGGTVGSRAVLNITQGDIRSVEKGDNLSDGGQLLYTTTSTTVWQTYWSVGGGFSTGAIATGQVNAFQSLKVVTPDGWHHVYLATPDHVQEYKWYGASSGGGEIIRISQNNIKGIAQQLDNGIQLLFTGAGSTVWETWWDSSYGYSSSGLFSVSQ